MGGEKDVGHPNLLPSERCWRLFFRLPGPPLTRESVISYLVHHNVTVGLGIEELWEARNARFDVGWVSSEN